MSDLRMDDEARLRRVLRYLEGEAPPAPDLHEVASHQISFRSWQEPRRIPKALTPILAAVAVLAVIGLPAILLGGGFEEGVGNTPSQTTTQGELFSSNMNGWTLVAVMSSEDEPDVGVYIGPLPDAEGEVTWITGERGFWPPRDLDGDPLLIYKETSDIPIELSDRPYALVWKEEGLTTGIAVADPIDLLNGSKSDGVNVLERSERVHVVDQAAWEDFQAAIKRDR